jgi:hypothetical protein
MTHLEEAAAELRKAREANDRRAADPDPFGRPSRQAEVHAERLRIAAGFERLAAIDRGLPPCCCHDARPEQEALCQQGQS